MKVIKNIIIFLLLFSIIPVANASLNIDTFTSSVYNLGDSVLFSGDVSYQDDIRANLNLILNCNGKNSQISVILFNLKSNEAQKFSRFVTLPVDLSGSCNLQMQLVDLEDRNLDSKQIKAFDLSDELKGTFQINNLQYQLGDSLNIKGTVTNQNNKPVDGVLIIFFKKDSTNLFLETVEISKGVLDYNKILNKVPPGRYSVDVLVKDNFGNTKTFTTLFNFLINSNLNLVSNLDKTIYLPGDRLVLTGYVSTDNSKQIKNINVDFNFENQDLNRKLLSSSDSFTINYDIPRNIKTENHAISIVASDDEGNYVLKTVKFEVKAIPTSLNIQLRTASYDPEQNVEFNVQLLDQAGDPIKENFNVDLLNTKGKVVYSKAVASGDLSSILVPKSATPGIWKLKINSLGLEDTAEFNVREYKMLNAVIQDSELKLENTGNVPYNGILDIFANEEKKNEDLDLDVGEIETLKLNKLFKPGVYNIKLPEFNKIFNDVEVTKAKSLFDGITGRVTGDVGKNSSGLGRRSLLFIALVIICGSLVYLFIGKRKKKDDIFGNKYLKEKRKLDKKLSKENVPNKIEFGKATQEDIDYWKKKVQDSFKQDEEKNNNTMVRNIPRTMENDNKPKEGMFNMFN